MSEKAKTNFPTKEVVILVFTVFSVIFAEVLIAHKINHNPTLKQQEAKVQKLMIMFSHNQVK